MQHKCKHLQKCILDQCNQNNADQRNMFGQQKSEKSFFDHFFIKLNLQCTSSREKHKNRKPWPYMESRGLSNRCNLTEWRLMRTGSSDLIRKMEVREMRARRCREHCRLTGRVSVETWQEKFHRFGNVIKHSTRGGDRFQIWANRWIRKQLLLLLQHEWQSLTAHTGLNHLFYLRNTN